MILVAAHTFPDGDRRGATDGLDDGAEDFAAAGVALGMDDAVAAMAGFEAEADRALRRAVEAGAEGRKFVDQGRRRLDDAAGDNRVAKAVAGGERVGQMQFGAVIGADRRSQAALRPGAGGLFAERCL